MDNLTSITTTQTKNEFQYDVDGNLIVVKDAMDNITQYEYDSFNNLKKISFPNETSISFTYDAFGRLICENR